MSIRKVHVPADFSRMGPAQEIKLPASRIAFAREVSRYIADSTHANLLKKVCGSLPGIASRAIPALFRAHKRCTPAAYGGDGDAAE